MRRFAVAIVLVVIASRLPANAQPVPSLQIVVIEGEDAVNIIEQKTAVAALVEVRDRNNLPVSGASVTFTIAGGNSASFSGGARALTVATDATGRARAASLNLLRSGKFQIEVRATYQGQLATAAISQTTVETAAAAAAIGAGAATGGAAGAGGLSATTIAIVGGAAVGGALAAREVVGGGSGGGGSGGSEFSSFSGSLSGQLIFTTVIQGSPSPPCVWTRAVSGTMKIDFKNADHAVGNVSLEAAETDVSVGGTCILVSGPGLMFTLAIDATGGPGALTFSGTSQSAFISHKVGFNGALSGATITGTLSIETVQTAVNPATGASGSGSTSFPVTLRQVN